MPPELNGEWSSRILVHVSFEPPSIEVCTRFHWWTGFSVHYVSVHLHKVNESGWIVYFMQIVLQWTCAARQTRLSGTVWAPRQCPHRKGIGYYHFISYAILLRKLGWLNHCPFLNLSSKPTFTGELFHISFEPAFVFIPVFFLCITCILSSMF